MNVCKKQILEALSAVIDPEVGLNIVEMGLVYGVELCGSEVHVRMTLTTQGCPLSSYLRGEALRAVQSVPGVRAVNVELVWEPAWSPEMISPDAIERLEHER